MRQQRLLVDDWQIGERHVATTAASGDHPSDDLRVERRARQPMTKKIAQPALLPREQGRARAPSPAPARAREARHRGG
jgi:hypothetical protein